MNSHIFSFSGASCSGKTTTLYQVARFLKKNDIFPGYKIEVFGEEIRDIISQTYPGRDISIDEIRKIPGAFLSIEEKVIKRYIKRENILSYKNTIILQDRALTDVLFYLENYVDKTSLTEDDGMLFVSLQNMLLKKLDESNYWPITVFEFTPIYKKIENDILRPQAITSLKWYENICISRLNTYFYKNNVCKINLNTETLNDILKKISFKIRESLLCDEKLPLEIQNYEWDVKLFYSLQQSDEK